jgi:hypothetical protein
VCGWALVWTQRLPGPKGPWCGDGSYPACAWIVGSESERSGMSTQARDLCRQQQGTAAPVLG